MLQSHRFLVAAASYSVIYHNAIHLQGHKRLGALLLKKMKTGQSEWFPCNTALNDQRASPPAFSASPGHLAVTALLEDLSVPGGDLAALRKTD